MDGYYHQQARLPYFSGYHRQRGSGIGALVAGVGRVALPFIRNYALPVAKSIGKELLREGLPEVLEILTKRQTPKQAFRNTVTKTVRKQVGGASKRKPRKTKKRKRAVISKRKTGKRSRSDFFSRVQNDK